MNSSFGDDAPEPRLHYPLLMDREDKPRGGTANGRRPLLSGQFRLLDTKMEEVRNLHERDSAGCSSCVEALVNDLAGIRFVLRAALLVGGLGRAEREELERREHEARELLREVVALQTDRMRYENRP